MKTYTLITGASSGIGRSLAIEAAKDGRDLILVARNKKALAALAGQLPVRTHVFTVDLTDQKQLHGLLLDIKKQNLTVNELINNAGFGDYDPFVSSDLDKQLNMIQLNISSLITLTHELLPSIIKTRGKIMNLASVAAFLPGPYMSVYFASKAFVLSFSEALNAELKDSGVTVTSLCPGPTKTRFASAAHVAKNQAIANAKITPEQVAVYGWRSMQRGTPVAIYSANNKLSVFIVSRLLPRSVVRWFIARAQRPPATS